MDKITLPTKTKIAAWWMIVIGGCCLGLFLLSLAFFCGLKTDTFSTGYALGDVAIALLSFSLMMPTGLGIILFLAGFLLFRRKKWGWKFAISVLPIVLIISFLFIIYIITSAHYKSEFLEENPYLVFLIVIPSIILFVVILIPFILLLLDRKNFWKSIS